MAIKNLLLLLLVAVLAAGCTTVKNYDSKLEAGPARPAKYPIYVYSEKVPVPRPFEVVGTMSIRDTPLTVFGGSFESEMAALQKAARRKGADAVQLTSVEAPDFLHAKYRVEANLIRFTEAWESIALAEAEVQAYFRDHQATLDPIEGIWLANDVVQTRVAIMRNTTWAGRDFIAFILNTTNPTWQRGDKKLDLARGERSGVYRGNFYFDDYRRKGVAFSLLGTRNIFIVPMADDAPPLIFTKQ